MGKSKISKKQYELMEGKKQKELKNYLLKMEKECLERFGVLPRRMTGYAYPSK